MEGNPASVMFAPHMQVALLYADFFDSKYREMRLPVDPKEECRPVGTPHKLVFSDVVGHFPIEFPLQGRDKTPRLRLTLRLCSPPSRAL